MTSPGMIHVVDDDDAVRTAFVFALHAVGFPAVPYVSAADFLQRGRQQGGVLISDVRMAGMNGIELTHFLRRDGATMPIILITGHADSELQAEARNAGADLVLGKPIELATLIAELSWMTRHTD